MSSRIHVCNGCGKTYDCFGCAVATEEIEHCSECFDKKEKMTEIFKVGDVVEAFGVRGEVTSISEVVYPVAVKFVTRDNIVVCFTKDGRLNTWHFEPSLKLIERPKKKVTKTVEAWMNVYRGDQHSVHTLEKIADEVVKYYGMDRIACVKLTGTYEVES